MYVERNEPAHEILILIADAQKPMLAYPAGEDIGTTALKLSLFEISSNILQIKGAVAPTLLRHCN